MEKTKNYFFSGSEHYIVDMRIKNIIKDLDIDEFDIATYDLEEASLVDALNDAYTVPFLNDKKVVILKNPYFLTAKKIKPVVENDPELLINYLRTPNPQTVLIIKSYYDKLDNKKTAVKAVKSLTEFEDCDYVDIDNLKKWTNKQFEKNGIETNLGVVTELIERCDFKLQNITNEIHKIINYLDDKKVLTINDIKELVPRNLEQNVFNLTNALFERNKDNITNIYYDLINSNVDPIMILGTLSSYLENVLFVKSLLNDGYNKNEIASTLGISGGRAYYATQTAAKITLPAIEELVIKISDTDFQIKSGEIDRFLGLELFILGI